VADADLVTESVSNEQTIRNRLDPGFVKNSVGLQFSVPRIETTVSIYVAFSREFPTRFLWKNSHSGQELFLENVISRTILLAPPWNSTGFQPVNTQTRCFGATFWCHLELVRGALLCISVRLSTKRRCHSTGPIRAGGFKLEVQHFLKEGELHGRALHSP
jgi:hypothetical protein